MEIQMNGYWRPISSWDKVGYVWICVCKKETRRLVAGSCPSCDRPLPDIDPNVWYQKELLKPTKDKAWNKL